MYKRQAFYSHTLTPAERKYSAFDRELLAVYLAVKHFKHFLEGRQFIIYTDHKPLTHAIVSASDNRSPRQTRHLSFISEFSTDVRHIKGDRNVVADTLSRPSVSQPQIAVNSVTFPEVPSVDLADMAEAQDPAGLLETTSLLLKRVSFRGSVMWCDTTHGLLRPLVPLKFRRAVSAPYMLTLLGHFLTPTVVNIY